MTSEILHADPFALFQSWFDAARASESTLPEAVALATATSDGRPSVRMVLLKEHGEQGFVFFTNCESRKADELAQNPRAALLFHWKALGRQVRIEGVVERVSSEISKAYFDTRPRKSRLSAWASPQSRDIPDRAHLEARMAEQEQRYPNENIPLPPFWGGYRVIPDRFEFWIDRRDRLHDRIVYARQTDDSWQQSRIAP